MARQRIFAHHAWLGPGTFRRRIVIEFDHEVTGVTTLMPQELIPAGCIEVGWLMPGLVNAHCHLEYTWLAQRDLPSGEGPFGEWMRAIISMGAQTPDDIASRAAGMGQGARDLVRGGCTTVFDSSTDGASEEPLAEAGLRYLLLHEVLGLSRARAEPMLNGALARMTAASIPGSRKLGQGLNPHAPYSVGEWLREQLAKSPLDSFSQAWHLAETNDEDELFRAGSGSIAAFLRSFRMPMPWTDDRAPGVTPSEWLEQQGLLDLCSLVFHGNHLSPAQVTRFTGRRGVVHCPGTHRWFKREPVPLRSWLDSGVNVCLGTDSLASSPSLSMLEMLQMVLLDHPDVSADETLTMACVNPWSLELTGNEEAGIATGLVPGARADFVGLVDNSHSSANDISNEISDEALWRHTLSAPLHEPGSPVSVWVGGQLISAG